MMGGGGERWMRGDGGLWGEVDEGWVFILCHYIRKVDEEEAVEAGGW